MAITTVEESCLGLALLRAGETLGKQLHAHNELPFDPSDPKTDYRLEVAREGDLVTITWFKVEETGCMGPTFTAVTDRIDHLLAEEGE